MVINASSKSYSPAEYDPIKNIQSPIPIVLVTHRDDFIFNEELENIGEYVLVDMVEYGWDKILVDTHLFGKNTKDFAYRFRGEEWQKFDDWVAQNQPTVYLKRELLKKDFGGNVFPIDYMCNIPAQPIQTREQFNGRPLNIIHYWGRSSEYRCHAHAGFWMTDSAICDNIYYLNDFMNREESNNKWVTLNIPHYARIDIMNLIAVQGFSKLSLSMKGCGNKCFRHNESPVNSIMVMEDAGIKFAYDWIDGENCIMYKGNDPIPTIQEALKRDDLYDIYLKGMQNVNNYRPENYLNYIETTIKEHL